jgi:hypothetical protein
MSNRKKSDWSPSANFVKSFFAVLPKDDMGNNYYWDQKTLNLVESANLRNQCVDITRSLQGYYKLLIDAEQSPYRTFSENGEP